MSALSAVRAAPAYDEQDLISAVRTGDDRAFELLYARYRPRIASYVLGMVGDHQRAEDIAQEVFIAALRRLRATERPIAFKPWIYEIAKNACIDEFRRARRAKEVPLEVDHEDVPPPRLIAHGADAAVERKQRLDDLRGAFQGLSESHHRIIVMRELEGRSYTQIGESLGMSKPVVESTLFRARRKLSEEYDELVTGRRCERVQDVIAADGERPLRSLGIKERRLLARHLSHCQACRRHARAAGVDESFFTTPSVAGKIAALLPFPLPWIRLRRGGGAGGSAAAAGAPPKSYAAVQSLQNAATYVDAGGPAAGLGRAAAAAAAIVVAGAGSGFLAGAGHSRMPTPRVAHPVPAHSSAPVATVRASAPAHHPATVAPPGWHVRSASAASAASRHRAHHRERRGGGSSSGGWGTHSTSTASSPSGSSTAAHSAPTSGSSGSSSAAAPSASGSGSASLPSAGSVVSAGGSALNHTIAAAAGTASKLLGGGGSGGSGSSNSSGSSIQLPSVGPVQPPKIPNPVSSVTSQVPSVPGVPDPNKLLNGLTGH